MSKTLYLPIKLNSTIPPNVGIFIPQHFTPAAAVNIIVYFHGHIIDVCKTLPTPFSKKGIEYYWGTPFFKCLRDELDASQTDAILIAPTFVQKLGDGNAATYGNLNAKGKLDFLIDESLTKLKESKDLPAKAEAGKIILAGHSAGGLPMLRILEAKNSLKSNIAECWGFECLYWDTGGWQDWLADNSSKQFRHFRQPGAQSARIKTLKGHANFIDVADGK